MIYLLKNWGNTKLILKDKTIVLFLDYDGTLALIAKTPAQAVLSKENRYLLKKLFSKLHSRIVIISGRSIADIKSIVGIKGITYAGNHGLEIEGERIKLRSPISAKAKSAIRRIVKVFSKQLLTVGGSFVEDKGASLSVHYRLASKKNTLLFLKNITRLIKPYMANNKIKVNYGKKVCEIKPFGSWDKGQAVLWLLAKIKKIVKKNNIFPIYIGDDTTDEDAFRVLKNKGLTVFVGKPKKTCAKYYLKNPKEVHIFLKWIYEMV